MDFLTELFILLIAALVVVPLLGRLGLSSVIGYLVAGVAIGPVLGLLGDAQHLLHFSEIGIVLLLFIIGLELQPRRLWVMRQAVFGLGTLQLTASSVAIGLVLWALGISFTIAAILGFALGLSSTAFVLQLLGEKKELNHAHGRSSFGVLLLQDLAVIPVITLLSIQGGSADAFNPWWLAVLAVGFVAARFLLRPLLRIVASTGIHELFIAASLAIVTGSALSMYAAGLSMGLGAFIAGMLVADSEYRHQLETDVMPFKGLLLGLFFIAVGMNADLRLLVDQPLTIIGLTVLLVLVKTLVMVPVALWHGLDRAAALKTAVLLSQGGEFAFVLLSVAVGASLIDNTILSMAVMVVTLSMASTPFLLMLVERLQSEDSEAREYDAMPEEHPPVIIAGFGRVGQIIARLLTMRGIHFTALEANPGQVDFVRGYGNEVYYGDATRLDLLQNAGVRKAKAIVITLDDIESSAHIVEVLRETCPNLAIYARARNRQHEIRLRQLGAKAVIRDTLLSSLALAEQLLIELGFDAEEAALSTAAFKEHDRKTLERQAAVAQDEQAFRQTTIDAAEELKQLFSIDQKT